jgi:DNA/RNA endonuclease YhcR with UshA esterase domain
MPRSRTIGVKWFAQFALAGALGVATEAFAANRVTPAEAIHHVGETATVCGCVASARYLTSGRMSTFLNLDQPYPNRVFTALIWGAVRPRFKQPPETLQGKSICVTGAISAYKGKAEIVVEDPGQIVVQP